MNQRVRDGVPLLNSTLRLLVKEESLGKNVVEKVAKKWWEEKTKKTAVTKESNEEKKEEKNQYTKGLLVGS